MQTAISLTLAFFALISAMGAYRDVERIQRDPHLNRYLGLIAAVVVTLWCVYASWWMLAH